MVGQGSNGFCLVDIWESEDAVRRFREMISPIAQEVGIEEPPEFFPAHRFVSGLPARPARYRVARRVLTGLLAPHAPRAAQP